MKSRKKLIFGLLFIFAVSIFAIGCGGKKTEAPKEPAKPAGITMRLGDVHPPYYPTVIGNKKFAELVEQKTNGRIKIEVYHSGQLGDEKAVIEQVQLGAIEFTRISSSPLGEFSKPFGVFSLPYIFDNTDHLWRYLESDDGKALLTGLESSRMRGLAYYASGTRSFYSSKPLNSVEDLRGKNIRVQQSKINMEMISALGATPTPMPYGEVFGGLQSGTIDVAENNFPSYLSANHYQVARYFINDQHQMVPEVLLISKVAWDKLSEEDKKIIEEAAWESVKYQIESWNAFEKEAREKVVAAGSIVVDVADLSPWQAAVKSVVDSYRDEFRAQLEAIERYRNR
jgi:tripartite ATP-independent transporter DctP family solute receptor